MESCRNVIIGFLSLMMAIGAVSCGRQGSLNPVTGKVLLNEQPLAGAKVILHPADASKVKTEWPVGTTQSDGTFAVTTGGIPGAAAGQYKVSIVCMEAVAPKTGKGVQMSMDMAQEVDRLKGAYSNPETSKLAVEVKSGSNELEPFKLK